MQKYESCSKLFSKKKKTLKKLKIVNLDVVEGLEAARAPSQSPSHNV